MAPRPINTQPKGAEVQLEQVGGPSVASQMGKLDYRVNNAPFEALSDFGGQLQEYGLKMALPEMEARGSQAVTRDPATGALTVQLRTPLNELDEAYNHSAQAAFASQSQGDRRKALQALAIEHMDDPEKFQELASAYVKTQAGGEGVPTALRSDLLNTGMEDVSQFTLNLTAKKQDRDTRNQLASVKSNIERGWNDVFSLAHNGGTATPDFQGALAQVTNLYGTLRNPVFGMTQDQIDAEVSEKLGAAEGEAALGQALAVAKEKGSQAGLDFLDAAVWKRELNLSPAQRESFNSRGRREIGELDAMERDARTELRQVVESRLDDAQARALATGDWQAVISPDEISRAYANNPARAADIIGKLNGAADTFSMRKQVANASPADLAAMDKRLNPGAAPAVPQGFDAFYSGFLAPHEGGYAASDGGGGPVNFGVNQDANPDIDVKNLTPDQAKTIVRDRYWLASGADKLPAALAAVHGDTAVNMGTGAAKDLLDKSGGDAAKYLSLREARYREIAAAKPEKAKDLPVWLQRNEDLRRFVTGGSFADKQRTYSAFQEALQQRNQALAKDPAGYAAAARPEMAAMLQSEDASTFLLGVRTSLQVQRDFGVNAPRILSTPQTSGIVQQFNNPPDPAKRADHMVGIVGSLEQRYGEYFPRVMSELQKAGMPTEAIALAQVKNDPAVAARMSNAVNAGRTTLRKITPEAEKIDKDVLTGLSSFTRTLAGQSGNSRVAAQQAEAAQLYAYQLAQEGVSNPSQRAVQDIIGKHFTFASTFRVPTGVNAHDVEVGTRMLLRDLPTGAIMPEELLGDPRATADTRQKIAGQILRSKGVWLTLGDDSGLYLAYPGEQGYAPARTKDGKQIRYTWAQLSGAAPKITAADEQRAMLGALQ